MYECDVQRNKDAFVVIVKERHTHTISSENSNNQTVASCKQTCKQNEIASKGHFMMLSFYD